MIRATEATHVEAECVGGTTLPCGIKRAAPINRMLGEALEAFIDVLDKHTLADLIGVEAPRGDTARRRVLTACARRQRREPLAAATAYTNPHPTYLLRMSLPCRVILST